MTATADARSQPVTASSTDAAGDLRPSLHSDHSPIEGFSSSPGITCTLFDWNRHLALEKDNRDRDRVAT